MLNRKGDDGSTKRSHLEVRARQGSQDAVNALLGPEPPDTLLYLMEWAYGLCGRSGASMAGIAPLGYGTIAEWARLMSIEPSPLEVQALILLDGVIRNPEAVDDEPDEPKDIEPWPT